MFNNPYTKIIISIALIMLILALLYKFDFFKSKETKDAEKIDDEINKDKSTSKDKKKAYATTNVTLQMIDFSKKYDLLMESVGTFNDDEEKMTQVFRTFKNRIEFERFSKYFGNVKKENLADWLKDNFSDSEVAKVFNIIKKLK